LTEHGRKSLRLVFSVAEFTAVADFGAACPGIVSMITPGNCSLFSHCYFSLFVFFKDKAEAGQS
jgi:hypothetical protein